MKKKKYKIKHELSIYFGVPGSGKTTLAAWLTKNDLRHGGKVWSNVPITGAYKLDPRKDIGKYMICGGREIIDEAGVEYNNRQTKTFTPELISHYKYHRHLELAVDIFSQSHEDCDVTLRRLAKNIYVVSKCVLPWFVCRRRIARKVGIDEVTHQIIDLYYWAPFSRRYIFSPPLWKSFNTLSREPLPEKIWETW